MLSDVAAARAEPIPTLVPVERSPFEVRADDVGEDLSREKSLKNAASSQRRGLMEIPG